MYLVAVALCAALSLVDISGAQNCVGPDGQSDGNCRGCTVAGDPHIYTYDPHTLIGAPANPLTQYESPKRGSDGLYAISQLGKDNEPSFGVNARIKQCFNDTEGVALGRTAACVSSVYYTEPGISVELMLPEKASTALSYDPKTVLYCQENNRGDHGAPPAPNDPLCATKIIVNDNAGVIVDGESVSSFTATDGKVWIIIEEGCNSYKCQIYIVGSKGITVSLVVDPGLERDGPVMYSINVYSSPSLHDTLYGLCDTYTGNLTNDYTPRIGEVITNFDELDTGFIKTWKIGCSCAFIEEQYFPSGCYITEAAPAKQACRCTLGEAAGGPGSCVGTVVDCMDPSAPFCTDPGTGIGSCVQGKGNLGNCAGYNILSHRESNG